MKTSGTQKFKGLWMLLRIGPVLSWSVSAVALGFGLAVHSAGYRDLNYLHLMLLLAICVLFQGLAAHAFNDREDWCSGTDRYSPGIISGGSGVVKQGIFNLRDLSLIGAVTMALGTALGLYFVYYYGLFILLLLSIGIWAAVAYTTPPVRLAYRPLLGEWLGAWPATVACTLGTFYILTGRFTWLALAAASVHGTFSVAWLMQHHIADIPGDLGATPPKLTTPAWAARVFGLPAARCVVSFYFLLLIGQSVILYYWAHKIFAVPALLGIGGAYLALATDADRVTDITRREIGMILLSAMNTLVLTVFFTLSGIR
jgi:1,4-dihydroxy-2-naphthoate octaprenyltransferase